MAITPQLLAGNLTTSAATIYTVPANTISKIGVIIAPQNSSGTLTFTVHVGVTDWEIAFITLNSAAAQYVNVDGLFLPAGTVVKAFGSISALSYVMTVLELT